ncbi:unnamed protein product [Haemonchus placei]|uniref:Amine oxidase n=1 Tax=Haemonchus placei TaxID=6290 RepID=A0A0N4WV24_HAEPC|nr:unnamed protein product [Haemonchus placei]
MLDEMTVGIPFANVFNLLVPHAKDASSIGDLRNSKTETKNEAFGLSLSVGPFAPVFGPRFSLVIVFDSKEGTEGPGEKKKRLHYMGPILAVDQLEAWHNHFQIPSLMPVLPGKTVGGTVPTEAH